MRVFREGRSGYAYGSDLGEEGLRALARAAARGGRGDGAGRARRHRAAAEPAQVDGLRRAGVRRVDDGARASSWRWRSSARRASATRSSATSRTPSTPTARRRVGARQLERLLRVFEQTQCYAYAYAFAGEGADRMTGIGRRRWRAGPAARPGGGRPGGRRPGGRAARRAAAQSRRCPVVLDPYVAASFASVIGRTLSADAVQRGRSLFAGKEGERIADPALRLLDDGTRPGRPRDGAVRRRGRPAAAHRR